VDQQHAWHDTGMERVYTTPLLDKLGVRPGMRVALIAIDDASIRPLLAERTSDVSDGWPEPDTDLVFLGADSTDALAPLETLASAIRPNGAIWVVSRKGKAATLRDVDVIEAAKAARLVDNKVVSFSPTHTSLRLVIPVTRRSRWCRAGRGRGNLIRALYHPCMPDLLLVLIVILVLAIVWRGPKTLPRLGEALGRGVREARTEAVKAQDEIQARMGGTDETAKPGDDKRG
jgi:Sec-independent protein translocase protein TatA